MEVIFKYYATPLLFEHQNRVNERITQHRTYTLSLDLSSNRTGAYRVTGVSVCKHQQYAHFIETNKI